MRIPLMIPEEKFFRAFDKNTLPATLLSRLGAGEGDLLRGKRKGERFFLYRGKKGRFSLFSCTLRGRVVTEESGTWLRCRFTRPLVSGFFWLLWCLLLLFTGFSLLFSEPFFALWFLLPGAALSLPLFLFSRKEKKALTDALSSLAGNVTK